MPRRVRNMIRLVEAIGWEQAGHVGSHRQYEPIPEPTSVDATVVDVPAA